MKRINLNKINIMNNMNYVTGLNKLNTKWNELN